MTERSLTLTFDSGLAVKITHGRAGSDLFAVEFFDDDHVQTGFECGYIPDLVKRVLGEWLCEQLEGGGERPRAVGFEVRTGGPVRVSHNRVDHTGPDAIPNAARSILDTINRWSADT